MPAAGQLSTEPSGQNQQAKQTARSAHVSLATRPHQVGDRRTGAGLLATPAKEIRSARPRREGGARVGLRLQGDRAFRPCTHVAVTALAPGGPAAGSSKIPKPRTGKKGSPSGR